MRATTRAVLLGCLFVSCATSVLRGEPFVTIRQGRFVDADGRHVILHGINIGGKHKSTDYLSWHGPTEFAQMRQWGFNCVRLLIIWAAIEPEPGQYDEAYLSRIDERIAWAKRQGLGVILDMHQDLWGEKAGIGDGAPVWATLDKGRPHYRLGLIWSDAYLVSPLVQTAFDSFWANAPGPDGVGIQERFALAWRHVAERYADEPAVIGYDLFNEPFPGSPILIGAAKTWPYFVEALDAEGPLDMLFRLSRLGRDPSSRFALYSRFSDLDFYKAYIGAGEEVFQAFERDKLVPMYRRVGRAIREVDDRHILFVEPCIMANQGVLSALEPIRDERGEVDRLQALAPHAYDMTTEMEGAGGAHGSRIELIYERLAEKAADLGVPLLIGEWGALGSATNPLETAKANVRQFERFGASDTYWYFNRRIEERDYFEMIQRPYPAAVAGELRRYHADPGSGRFECVWEEDPSIEAPSRIYLPANWYPKGCAMKIEPPGPGHRFERVRSTEPDGYLNIKPLGRACLRRVEVIADR